MRKNYIAQMCRLTLVLFSVGGFTACSQNFGDSAQSIPALKSLSGDSEDDIPLIDGSQMPKAHPVAYRESPVNVSAAWANDGGNKIIRQGTRATQNPSSVANSLWKDSRIQLFGAKNEVVAFNLVLEAANQTASHVTVSFDRLDGPGGAKISAAPASGNGIFNYNERDIELFLVRYLKIKGISRIAYNTYDERHVPKRFQRPNTLGVASGAWSDRPDHDQEYPDIAVPMESVNGFEIARGQNQSVWSDIYIPKDIPSGLYQGAVTVSEDSHVSYTLPVELNVHNFALPDSPSSKTMLNLGTSDIARRYIGMNNPESEQDVSRLQTIRDRHFQMAHRHKISLIDTNYGRVEGPNQPAQEWMPRLDGSLFSASQNYRGPGLNKGNGIFSVGTFGSWTWKNEGEAAMHEHSSEWARWFTQNSSNTEFFLYLVDESKDYDQIQTWASQLKLGGRSARNLASMATLDLTEAVKNTPALQVVTSTMDVGDTEAWDNAYAQIRSDSSNKFYMYNGKRPGSGTFMVDDDGVALREVAWGQYKKGIDRWFYWESTYYKDVQGGRGDIDVMNVAQTFGGPAEDDPVNGKTNGNYANGDGLLFYPGSDTVFPASSYGLDGPIASLRLKHWRRGIQDVDYLTLAARKNPGRVKQIVDSVVRSVLWENGVEDSHDPTYKKCDIGWSTDPDTWEAARLELANIIDGQ